MNSTKEITVVAKDRIGLLADVSETVAKAGINIDSISVDSSGRESIIRLMVNDPAKSKKALEAEGFKVLDTDILVVAIPDKPGELAKISRLMADNKISIDSMLVLNKEENGSVLVAMKASDYPAARKILRERKYL